MKIEDIEPALRAWDRLHAAINALTTAQPAMITHRAQELATQRALFAGQDMPEAMGIAWSSLQRAIGTTLVAAPHEMSASIERLEDRRQRMVDAIWSLAREIERPPEPAQAAVVPPAGGGRRRMSPQNHTRR